MNGKRQVGEEQKHADDFDLHVASVPPELISQYSDVAPKANTPEGERTLDYLRNGKLRLIVAVGNVRGNLEIWCMLSMEPGSSLLMLPGPHLRNMWDRSSEEETLKAIDKMFTRWWRHFRDEVMGPDDPGNTNLDFKLAFDVIPVRHGFGLQLHYSPRSFSPKQLGGLTRKAAKELFESWVKGCFGALRINALGQEAVESIVRFMRNVRSPIRN